MQDETARQILAELARLSRAVQALAPSAPATNNFDAAACFVWDADNQHLAPVTRPGPNSFQKRSSLLLFFFCVILPTSVAECRFL